MVFEWPLGMMDLRSPQDFSEKNTKLIIWKRTCAVFFSLVLFQKRDKETGSPGTETKNNAKIRHVHE